MHYTVPAFLALFTVENSSLASFFYINLTIYLNGSQLHNDKAQAAQLIAVYM